VQIKNQGGAYGVESPDGKFFYHLAETSEGGDTELRRVPVEGGEEIRITGLVHPQSFAVVERRYLLHLWLGESLGAAI